MEEDRKGTLATTLPQAHSPATSLPLGAEPSHPHLAPFFSTCHSSSHGADAHSLVLNEIKLNFLWKTLRFSPPHIPTQILK